MTVMRTIRQETLMDSYLPNAAGGSLRLRHRISEDIHSATTGPEGTNNKVGTSQAIDSGRYNTERLVEYMDIEGKAYSDARG